MDIKNKFFIIRKLLSFNKADMPLVKKENDSPFFLSALSHSIIYLIYPVIVYGVYLIPVKNIGIKAILNTAGISFWLMVHLSLNHFKSDGSWAYKLYSHFFPKNKDSTINNYNEYIKEITPILKNKDNRATIIEFLNVFCVAYIDSLGHREDSFYNQLLLLKQYFEEGNIESAVHLFYKIDQAKSLYYHKYDSMLVKNVVPAAPQEAKIENATYPIEPHLRAKVDTIIKDINELFSADWEPEIKFNLNNILKSSLPSSIENIESIPPKFRQEKSVYSSLTPQQMFNDSVNNIEKYVLEIKQLKINQNIKNLAINSKMHSLYSRK